MKTNKITNDFLGFTRSKMGFRTSELARDMINGRGGFRGGYMNPYILEESDQHLMTIDCFSKLLQSRIIFFGTEVNPDTANILVSQLLYLDSVSEDEIKIYLNSPGGSITDGCSILDTMDFIKAPVSTLCTGMAASFGAVILAYGEKGKRSILPRGRVMIHQPRGGAQGTSSDIQIEAKLINDMKEELTRVLAEKTGQSYDKIWKDTELDYWMNSKEALEYGMVDNIITPSRDSIESKKETRKRTIKKDKK